MLAGALLAVLLLAASSAGEGCGGVLVAKHGIIQTPDFPRMFSVPISCRWVIDSSSMPDETSIVVYLTQLFVTTGLTFTEYTYYEPDSSFQLNPKLIYEVSEDDVITTKWVLTRTRYFVIEFNLERLEGNHLRVLDDLLDVYGFNITYEMSPDPGPESTAFRNDSCSVLTCSLAGNCYVSLDFSTFWCKCFEGFYGPGCMLGPLCRENSNLCRNGATCRHVGTSAMCECPPGFTGPHCEVPLLMTECDSEKEDDCTTQCRYDGRPENACKCDPNGKVSPGSLPESKGTAMKCLRKFERDPEMTVANCAKVQENVDKGYARVLTDEEAAQNTAKTWYGEAEIPRMFSSLPTANSKVALQVFCEASPKAYTASECVWKRLAEVTDLSFVFSRAKLAPTRDTREGLSFLRDQEGTWPKGGPNQIETQEEEQYFVGVMVMDSICREPPYIQRFDSFLRLVRTTGSHRLKWNAKNPKRKSVLLPFEIDAAEFLWSRKSQLDALKKEISVPGKKKGLCKMRRSYHLTPKWDEQHQLFCVRAVRKSKMLHIFTNAPPATSPSSFIVDILERTGKQASRMSKPRRRRTGGTSPSSSFYEK